MCKETPCDCVGIGIVLSKIIRSGVGYIACMFAILQWNFQIIYHTRDPNPYSVYYIYLFTHVGTERSDYQQICGSANTEGQVSDCCVGVACN